MFTGPTGTNAVEAAIKLARKVTGREMVVAFTNGFHGMTLGALACTGHAAKRGGAGVPLSHVSHEPYDGYYGPDVDNASLLEHPLEIARASCRAIVCPSVYIWVVAVYLQKHINTIILLRYPPNSKQ